MRRHIVIIGNGVAGVTAARFIRKMSDDDLTIVSDETDHFYARTALMYVYMGHLRYKDTKPYEDWFWPKNRIGLVRGYVSAIDTERKRLTLSDGASIRYDVLILATGSRPRRHGWPGEELDGVQALYGMPDLERMERMTRGIRRAVVVGGGLIGVEMAEMLHSRHIPVTFLVRERSYMDHVLPPEESEMVNEAIREHGIDLRLGTEVAEIVPGTDGRVRAVVTGRGVEIPCEFAGLTIGVEPNVAFLCGSGVETGRGIFVNEYFETNAPDVYAVGDCAEFRDPSVGHRPVEQLWYTARKHGWTVAHTICGRRLSYQKSVFFNSAKFFNLEYQVYGDISPQPRPGEQTLFWRDPRSRRSVRINYRGEMEEVVGFNLMGVRFRQEVCERWINERRNVSYVLQHLPEASFDPEFERRFEPEITQQYERLSVSLAGGNGSPSEAGAMAATPHVS